MKSKTSCFNKTIFKKNMTHFWPIWLIALGWNLFVLPFSLYMTNANRGDVSQMTDAELAGQKTLELVQHIQTFASPIILFLFAVAAAMAVFSYLYTSRAANTFHAFPVTRKELYVTSYVSGLSFLILPELIGFLFGTIVAAASGYTEIPYLLKGLLLAAGISFFMYSFTVFIAMFTGQLIAVPVFAGILNVLFVGACMLFASIRSQISYGFTGSYELGKWGILSPLVYLYSKVGYDCDYSGQIPKVLGINGGTTVAGYAVAGIVFAVLAYLIYRKRQIECAGSLLSMPWISPVFRWGVGVCGAMLFGTIFGSMFSSKFIPLLIFGVLFGIVFFLIAQMFVEKGFRIFKKHLMVECGVFAAGMILLFVGVEYDFLGQEKKIPDASEISYVTLNGRNTMTTDDEKWIEEIRGIHQDIITSKKEFESMSDDHTRDYVQITYYLKNNTIFRRAYTIPSSDEDYDDPDSVASRILDFYNNPDIYMQIAFGVNYKDQTFQGAEIDLYDDNNEYYSAKTQEEGAVKLVEALKKDLEEGNMRACIREHYDSDDYQKDTYYNSIQITTYCKDGIKDPSDRYWNNKRLSDDAYAVNRFGIYTNSESVYQESAMRKSNVVNITFDKNCTNLIRALEENGMIHGTEDLISIEKKNEQEDDDTVDAYEYE